MKEMEIKTDILAEGVIEIKEDKLEVILAESERILNRINERLERIINRQKEMEEKAKQLEGLFYFID
jgi:uncharacterized coiled-coil protein SlyX